MSRIISIFYLCLAAVSHAEDSPAKNSPWWHQMFSLSFDGHGMFVAPHLETLNTIAASPAAVGFHGPWQADLIRDARSMQTRFEAFGKRPATKRIIYIDGVSSNKILARVSPDGRVIFTSEVMKGFSDPERRKYVEELIKPSDRTIWLSDWEFMQSPAIKTSLGKPIPTALEIGIKPFIHPLTGAVITDEVEFWQTRTAKPLIGEDKESIKEYAEIPENIATALGLKNITTQREDGQWLILSSNHMIYDAAFAKFQAAKASRVIESLAPDMIHYDDWDLRSPSAMNGKADIYVAAFREFVKNRLSKEECHALGFEKENVANFDVLNYLRNPPWREEYKGEGTSPQWRCASDTRWLSNKVWRVFQIACIEDRLASMKEVYRLNKATAKTLGRDVPMVANIIPTLSATFLQRDCVDMSNLEWPVFKTYGAYPNSLGYYPQARLGIGPRMASKIGTTGHAMVDPYVEKKYSGWDGNGFTHRNGETLHKVIYFDLIANRGIPAFALSWDGAYSPGSVHSAGQLHSFINEISPIVSGRKYIADIGLVASSWSQIAATTPWGEANHAISKRYLAEFLGWSQYLASARDFPQWDVLPFDDAKFADLARFKLIILPSVLVITSDHLDLLERFLKEGGKLLITGETGTFTGPPSLLMPRSEDIFTPLALRFPGQITRTNSKPGLDYHLDSNNASALQALLKTTSTHQPVITVTKAPEHIGIYASESRITPGEFTIDLVNYHHDLESDQLTPVISNEFQVQIQTPTLTSAPQIEAIRYDEAAPNNITRHPLAAEAINFENGRLALRIPPFTHYQLLRIYHAK